MQTREPAYDGHAYTRTSTTACKTRWARRATSIWEKRNEGNEETMNGKQENNKWETGKRENEETGHVYTNEANRRRTRSGERGKESTTRLASPIIPLPTPSLENSHSRTTAPSSLELRNAKRSHRRRPRVLVGNNLVCSPFRCSLLLTHAFTHLAATAPPTSSTNPFRHPITPQCLLFAPNQCSTTRMLQTKGETEKRLER